MKFRKSEPGIQQRRSSYDSTYKSDDNRGFRLQETKWGQSTAKFVLQQRFGNGSQAKKAVNPAKQRAAELLREINKQIKKDKKRAKIFHQKSLQQFSSDLRIHKELNKQNAKIVFLQKRLKLARATEHLQITNSPCQKNNCFRRALHSPYVSHQKQKIKRVKCIFKSRQDAKLAAFDELNPILQKRDQVEFKQNQQNPHILHQFRHKTENIKSYSSLGPTSWTIAVQGRLPKWEQFESYGILEKVRNSEQYQ